MSEPARIAEKNTAIAELYLEVSALKKSLEEAKEKATFWQTRAESLDKKIETDYISKKAIVDHVSHLFKEGMLPPPCDIQKFNAPVFIEIDEDSVVVDRRNVSVNVGFVCSGSKHILRFNFLLFPASDEVYLYPGAHFGYTKPTLVKRVRKPKAKPAEVKKADKS